MPERREIVLRRVLSRARSWWDGPLRVARTVPCEKRGVRSEQSMASARTTEAWTNDGEGGGSKAAGSISPPKSCYLGCKISVFHFGLYLYLWRKDL